MPGPLSATGAISNPTRFGALNMGGEQFTGEWTQAGPYRDAATAYLIRKFYQGSRFDRIIDGLNREITVRLTDQRRPGSTVFNSNTFPPSLSFYPFKSVNNSGTEIIRVLEDGQDGTVYDATPGQKSTILAKAAGAGAMRFLGVNAELFMGDGKDLNKWIYPGGWVASTAVPPGTLINVGSAPGKVQMALGGITLPIVAYSSDGTYVTLYVDPENVPNQFANLVGVNVTFSGLSSATYLNGNTYPIATVLSSTLGLFRILLTEAVVAETTDSGTGSTGNGTTGSGTPAFSVTQFAVTADAGQQWKCYGTAVENWGLQTPTNAPTLTPINGTKFWEPNTAFAVFTGILDSNQNVEVAFNVNGGGTPPITGRSYPIWAAPPLDNSQPVTTTTDGQVAWSNYGQVGKWLASSTVAQIGVYVILDSNGNLQLLAGGTGTSGSTAPTWSTTIGAATTDGGLNWFCLGAGIVLTTASIQYAFSTVAIDGSVSTADPVATINGPILGVSMPPVTGYITIAGNFKQDTQLAALNIWRTPQGQSVLILEDQIPIDLFYAGSSFTYGEPGIPDTSTNGGGALNALIAAPVADANDPPPAGLTGMVWYLQRVWGFVGNKLYYSGGPDTIVGNGATAWPPANVIPFIGAVVKVRPITVQNGGLLVYTTSGIQIVLGTGTASNPFYDTIYCDKVNLGGYNVEDVLGSVIFMMEANGKVSSLTVQYPFNPQSGYSEVGLPIGDQFRLVTTGGISTALYNPATAYLSWCVANTQDTGMYVADGAVGWFRMSAVSPPESGLLWSPRAAIAGGTSAVQSIETSPGVFTLLIGPPAGTPGPILMRDTTGTAWSDNGVAYDAYDTKGVNLLCSTGQWTEVAHISAKSAAVGARPIVSVLLNEIAPVPTEGRSWDILRVTGPDPVRGRTSKSVYADRYDLAQNGIEDLGDCILTKFDYGTQAVADELLDWGIYASTEEERKEEAQK